MAELRRHLRDRLIPFSAYYAKKLDGIDLDSLREPADLARLPFTEKADLLSSPEHPNKARDFVLIPDEKVLAKRLSTIVRAVMRGKARVKAGFEREFRPILMTATTGRSSDPVPFLYSQHDIANLEEAGRRLMVLCDSRPDYRHLNVFPFAPHLAFWQMHYAGLGFNTFCLSTGGGKTMGTDGNVAMLEKIKPDAIIGMPTFLYHLLTTAAERGKRWRNLRRIVLGGEKVPQGLRTKLRELCAALGSHDVKIMATYGFTEAKTAWPECAFGQSDAPTGFHLYPDFGIFEVVDPETGAPRGEREPGEIVYTPINARGSCVLRYRTGDLIEGGIAWDPCPGCGRTLPRLIGRISRVSNIREMNLGKVKGTLVDFNELEHILDDAPGLGSWQIELRKKDDDPLGLDELVVHAQAMPNADEATLRREIGDRLARGAEIRPNDIVFHDPQAMRDRQGVGKALKEEKLVDHRPKR
ncbi:MAG: AMP-binding protein [Verrucomicrobiales bacterium]